MPIQTNKEDYIFPDGGSMEISNDNGISFHDVGTLAAGATLTYNYDKNEVESGNKAKPKSRAKNETVALAPSALWSQDLEVFEKFSGGAFNYTAVAGTLVSNATQTALSGGWLYQKFILIENQNYDVSAITINTVTGGTDGLLVVDTDYYVSQNSKGEYGIFILDSVTVTTEAQDMVIDYDYTPGVGKKITAGTSSIVLERFIVRLRHYTNDALTEFDIEAFIYGVDMDSGMQINFKGANEDGLFESTVSFTGNVDTSRPDGEQLFSLLIKDSIF